MKLNNEEIKSLYKGYVSRPKRKESTRCPSLRHLLLFFRIGGSTRKKMKLVDHLSNCADCFHGFNIILNLRRDQEDFAHSVSRIVLTYDPTYKATDLPPRGISFARLSSALVGVSLVFISLVIIFNSWKLTQVTRTGIRPVRIIQPISAHKYPSLLLFKWQNMEGADSYVLELFNDQLMPIWQSPRLQTVQISLPDNIYRQLDVNREYYWMITAYYQKAKLGESELMSLKFVIW